MTAPSEMFRSYWTTLRIYLRNLKNHSHEPETPYLRYLVANDDICLHIGASDGRHSYEMQKYASQGRIYGFEPSRYSVTVFRRLIKLHGLKNVSVECSAVGAAPGEMLLVTPIKKNGHVGRSFAFISQDGNATRSGHEWGTLTQKTPVVAVDDFVAQNKLPRVDLIRCDVEGAEMGVLEGARTTLAKDLPNLLLEIHPKMLAEHFGTTGEKVRDTILALGYRMFHLDGDRIVEGTALVDENWKDYFFIHPNRASRLPEGPFRDFFREPQTAAA